MKNFKKTAKIFKYVKPYKSTLILIILGFLAGQTCSLFLPNLMSEIVDVGIRQNGIENAYPEVMSSDAYEMLSAFMSIDEKNVVNRFYEFADFKENNQTENETFTNQEHSGRINYLIEKYPLAKGKSIYFLKSDSFGSEKEKDETNKIFLECATKLFKYLNSSGLSNEFVVWDKNDFQADLTGLYDMAPNFKEISKEQLERVNGENSINFDSHQAVATLNKQFYLELGADVSKIQQNYIIKIGVFMMIVTIISLAITVAENYFLSKMSSGILMKLREDIFYKVENFSQKEFDKITTSSLITRTVNDVGQMKETIMSGTLMFVPPVMLVGGIAMALNKSASLSWTILLGASVSSLVIYVVLILILPKMELMQKLLDRFNLVIKERLSGIMVASAFENVEWEEKRFDDVNAELSGISSYVNKLVLRVSPFLIVTMNFLSLLIIWLGADQIAQSKMQIGDLMAFVQYSSMVIGAFLMLVMMLFSLPHAFISINRILEVLDLEPSVKDPTERKYFGEEFRGKICFRNVSFTYGNKENCVLKNINFSAEKGQVISVIGATGAGKSTLVSLIPRFYDVTSGEVLIDGINVKDVSREDLRKKVTYVPQRSVLFSGDVEYNLRYGNPNAEEKKLTECMEICRISEFVNSDEGIKRKVSQEGKDFSGGQKQKICIARALLRDTPIYIFDDSFSSMDFFNDFTIRKNMRKVTKNSLVILVSQRICTVMNSDKILVLDKGEIVGEGTHEELLKSCPTYKETANSQLPEEIRI